jgi:hypothetical protein
MLAQLLVKDGKFGSWYACTRAPYKINRGSNVDKK